MRGIQNKISHIWTSLFLLIIVLCMCLRIPSVRADFSENDKDDSLPDSYEEYEEEDEYEDENDFKNEENVTCHSCPPGTFSNHIKTPNCTKVCSPGFCPQVSNCSVCIPGSFNPVFNATDCRKCDVGFISLWGSTNCTACGGGFSSNYPQTMCIPCDPGTYSPREGEPCLPCPPGQYSPSYTSKYCSLCPRGSFNNLQRQPICTACGQGYFNDKLGSLQQTDCQRCPAKYYCPYPMTGEPIACPVDHACKEGTANPEACSSLFTSDEKSEECHPTVYFYLLVIFGTLASLVILVAAFVCVKAVAKSKDKIPLERKHLIPDPLDGPVYSGLRNEKKTLRSF